MKLLLIVTSSNFVFVTNQYIYESLEKKTMEVVENIIEVSSKLRLIQQFFE